MALNLEAGMTLHLCLRIELSMLKSTPSESFPVGHMGVINMSILYSSCTVSEGSILYYEFNKTTFFQNSCGEFLILSPQNSTFLTNGVFAVCQMLINLSV